MKYQCVYCKKKFGWLYALKRHEDKCIMKPVKKNEWESRINKSLDAK